MTNSPKFRLVQEIVADAERTAPRDNCVHFICRALQRFRPFRHELYRPPPQIGDMLYGNIVVWVGPVKKGLPAHNEARSVIAINPKYF